MPCSGALFQTLRAEKNDPPDQRAAGFLGQGVDGEGNAGVAGGSAVMAARREAVRRVGHIDHAVLGWNHQRRGIGVKLFQRYLRRRA